MKNQTLADVFGDHTLKRSTRDLFSPEEMENTAELARAESVDNTSDLVNTLVANATDRLLEISLIDIMLGAWTKMTDLQQYATGEKLESPETHQFELAKHKITSKHSPRIELLVYDERVTEVIVDILLTLVIAKVILMIKQGRIVEVRISGCQATGTMSCHGKVLFEKTTAEFEFPSFITLGEGVQIPPPLTRKVA